MGLAPLEETPQTATSSLPPCGDAAKRGDKARGRGHAPGPRPPARQARALRACPEQGVPRPSPALPGGTARDTTTASSGGVGWACLNHGPAPRPGHHAFPTGVTGFAPEAHVSGQGRQAASSGFICDHDRPPVPVTGPPGWTTAGGGGSNPVAGAQAEPCRLQTPSAVVSPRQGRRGWAQDAGPSGARVPEEKKKRCWPCAKS